jgi:2-oxoglutarate ferredoxin oxidoreductase subunit alpha
VIAAATIEECFHFVIMARKLAEAFRTPVMLLTDANLATGVQPDPRPEPCDPDWLAPPIDQSPGRGRGALRLGPEPASRRARSPGSGAASTCSPAWPTPKQSKVAYDPDSNQRGLRDAQPQAGRAGQKHPEAAEVHGDPEGDLLVVGWGSTLGAIEEAWTGRARRARRSPPSTCVSCPRWSRDWRRSSPASSKVMTVEINYSDDPTRRRGSPGETRRYARSSPWLLRAQTLVDVDCWSAVRGSRSSRE